MDNHILANMRERLSLHVPYDTGCLLEPQYLDQIPEIAHWADNPQDAEFLNH